MIFYVVCWTDIDECKLDQDLCTSRGKVCINRDPRDERHGFVQFECACNEAAGEMEDPETGDCIGEQPL